VIAQAIAGFARPDRHLQLADLALARRAIGRCRRKRDAAHGSGIGSRTTAHAPCIHGRTARKNLVAYFEVERIRTSWRQRAISRQTFFARARIEPLTAIDIPIELALELELGLRDAIVRSPEPLWPAALGSEIAEKR
jgi:hypothetical protein